MNNKPLKKVKVDAPIKEVIEINEECQFIHDLENNNKLALWNLAVVKGQLTLFSKGIKPTRHWRLKDVKNYIGMSGNKEVLLEKVILLQDVLKGGK